MINIRPAKIEDLKFIVKIYNEAILTTTATFDLEPKTEEQQREWFQRRGDKNPILIAEQNDVIIGWASLNQYSDRKAYELTVESSLYIKKDYHGLGVGKKLLKTIIEEGRKIGLHTILAKITANNEISIRLHQSQGFERVGVMKEVGRKFGQFLDVLIMQKMLKASDFRSRE